MIKKRYAAYLILYFLAGCSSNTVEFSHLMEFMQTTGMDGKAKLDPLPPVQIVDSFEYSAGDLESPFKARNLRPEKGKGGGGGLQPDFNRPKEVLEEFPLDALRMMGIVRQQGKIYAVIQSPDGSLHKITKGNHLGLNFGVVTAISEDSGLQIKEIVLDSNGDWAESNAILSIK